MGELLLQGGISFPNIVAILLLPIFIIPGIAGLKVRLYVARRSDNYGRLDTVVYSWLLSAVSLLGIYLGVGYLTGDFTLVPSFLDVPQSVQANETGLRIPFVLGLYAVHFCLCVVIGGVFGAFAYNFIDEVQITDRHSKRELMLNKIAPGKDVVLRTKSGELFKGRVGSKWDTEDGEDILLRSPSQLIDRGGETWATEKRGPYLYMDSGEVSRISLADPTQSENLDPVAAIDKPDRLQAFIKSIGQELDPRFHLQSLEAPPRIAFAIAVLTTAAFCLFGGLLFATDVGGILQIQSTIGGQLPQAVGALVGLFGATLGLSAVMRSVLYGREARGVYWIALPAVPFLALVMAVLNPSIAYSVFFATPFNVVAGILTGFIALYVLFHYHRANSHLAITAFIISLATVVALEKLAKHVQPEISSGFMIWLAVTIIWLFYVAIHGGPSKRQPWAKRIKRPLIVGLSSIVVVGLAVGPWWVLTEPARPTQWLVRSVPYFGGLMLALSGYRIEINRYTGDRVRFVLNLVQAIVKRQDD